MYLVDKKPLQVDRRMTTAKREGNGLQSITGQKMVHQAMVLGRSQGERDAHFRHAALTNSRTSQ